MLFRSAGSWDYFPSTCKRYGDHLRNKSLDNVKENALGSSRAREAGAKKRNRGRSYENRGTEPRRVGAPADGLVEEAAQGATADGRDAAVFLAPVGAAVRGSLGNQRASHLKISMASDAELGYLRLPADGMAVTARRDADAAGQPVRRSDQRGGIACPARLVHGPARWQPCEFEFEFISSSAGDSW